ncbi:rod shape-determining protein MreC [Mucilaginibacter antarcticus]|uniref:Cell shape-determining protein MreC n=1 Tax=Mucilaginibacter antarcticus TaxID=1855725 RepID=A0ABW5XQ73_9SPHI
MRNLLIFISKYNAFFLFIIFEVGALIVYIKYNSFQKASFINSTNQVTGSLYTRYDQLRSYIFLREVNDSLSRENARLHTQLKASFYIDSAARHKITDTVYKQQYEYIDAAVINKSTNRRNNYLTINQGSRAGIAKGMGVISSQGVVGKVILVGQYMSVVQSLLHKETVISASLAGTNELGSFTWGDNLDPHMGLLYDVSNNATPKVGDLVVTSDRSLFPTGIPIGKIASLKSKTAKGLFLNMDVAIAVDFGKLQYVYVINNKLAAEQLGLEAQEKKDE